jgi:diguanylate cyclase (GGDEF)-like protein
MSDWFLIRTRRVRVATYFLYLLAALAVVINVADFVIGLEGDYRLELLLLPLVPATLFLSNYYHLHYLTNLVAAIVVFIYIAYYLLAGSMEPFAVMLFITAPMVFFFLTNLYVGLFLSAVLLIVYWVDSAVLSGGAGFQNSSLFIQGLSVYLVVTLLAWLYERDWLGIESRLLVNSDIDFLTQVHNRRGLKRMLQKSMADALRHRQELAVMMFEIDDFEELNSRHGRYMCDQLLIELAGLVGRHVRAGDCFGRWDAQRFMILAPYTDLKGAEKFAGKLHRLVKSYYFENIGHIRASLGVVALRHDNMEAFLEKLEAALKQARQQGDTVHVIEP